MTPNRYDVVYDSYGPSLEYHYCRDWEPDENGELVGCYGTNPDHGFSFDEAKQEIIDHFKRQIAYWEAMTEGRWVKADF